MIPKHVCIVPDGNRRWAKAQNKTLFEGYKAGLEAIESTLKKAIALGISYLTFFIISTENSKRDRDWVYLMRKLTDLFLYPKCQEAMKEGAKIKFLGDKEILGSSYAKTLSAIEELSVKNTKICLNFCFGYSGREEIISAVKQVAKKIKNIDECTVDSFSEHLFTKGMPDPDLFIRTSGEKRISNFLLWQLAYTELYFDECFWPDFSESHFENAIQDFQKRQRRFGV